MDFFSNFVKNTVNKVETLSKTATAAVTSLSPGAEDESGDNGDNGAANNGVDEHNNGSLTANNQGGDKMPRSSSGDTSGPDDDDEAQNNQNEATTDDPQDDGKGFNSNEMSQKALESAKYLGNFLFNVANKAGQTVSATAKQIKSTVESVGIMQEFTKEQQEFIKDHGGKTDISEPPWVGCEDEDNVRTEILSLSQDKRNFVRNPPQGVEFPFDMNSSYPIAMALLREDPELSKMRYSIVPKLVNEETFWRNYFYRVSLIKQDPNFSTAAGNKSGSWNSSRSSSSEGPDDPNEQSESVGDTEFVSDSFQPSNISVEEVRKDMSKLGLGQTGDELEAELAKDLQEFEVVTGNESVKVDEDEINRELANFDLK